MRVPLYKPVSDGPGSLSLGKDGNAGLWYDKFCNRWADQEWEIDRKGKTEWINTVTGDRVGARRLLEEMLDRTLGLVDLSGGEVRFYSTQGRFVTGLGRSHPLENGFAWHPTLGVPFLPGSSVKGLVRSWAEFWNGKKDEAKRVFGPDPHDSSHKAGTVVFLDALPTAPVRLEAEVMTPHYQEYYGGHNNPPGDWYNPLPISFLSVAGGCTFAFGVVPRKAHQPSVTGDLSLVLGWLDEALAGIGAGAKTAAGYGRLAPDLQAGCSWRERQEQERQRREEERRARERENELERLSPLRREMEQDGYSQAETGPFMNRLTTKWLDRMEKGEPFERREIAGLLLAWYRERLPNQFSNPNEKNAKKIERINRALPR